MRLRRSDALQEVSREVQALHRAEATPGESPGEVPVLPEVVFHLYAQGLYAWLEEV